MKPTAVTDSSFDKDVLHAEGPVLVDFWAEWCGPCKMIAPFLEDLAADKAGKLSIAKVNIDENPQSPMKYGIRSIPTMILFKAGEVAATKIGALPKSKLYEWVELGTVTGGHPNWTRFEGGPPSGTELEARRRSLFTKHKIADADLAFALKRWPIAGPLLARA